MFKRSLTTRRGQSTRLMLAVSLAAGLVTLAAWDFRGTRPVAVHRARAAESARRDVSGDSRQSPLPKLEGAAARVYVEQTSDGQSLMAALTAAQFGLKWHEHEPFAGGGGGGYLGMSHDQNLSAWFDEGGMTVRPTVSAKGRGGVWRLGMSLKAYGYGAQLQAARSPARHTVNGNRIEYERALSATGHRVVEWYVNKSEGIEQGFTLDARPVRADDTAEAEPLRLVVSVTGDLRAQMRAGGQEIELLDARGLGALSYSQLRAIDAGGKQLPARMEANAEGREIALVVEDAGAEYPIVIDPITETLEQKLDGGSSRQVDARFGFAVAIEGSRAAVGAWRYDVLANADAGAVYLFVKSSFDGTWAGSLYATGAAAGERCGHSVAMSSIKLVFGCPGSNSDAGRAFIGMSGGSPSIAELNPPAGFRSAGNQYGTSVAIDTLRTDFSSKVVVGSPLFTSSQPVASGVAFVFDAAFTGAPSYRATLFGTPIRNSQFGYSVAIDGDIILAGAPNETSRLGVTGGSVHVFERTSSNSWGPTQSFEAPDADSFDQFGESVDLSDNTGVIGAHSDDNERGQNAGAAYVFVRGGNGQWTQQQKLLAGDGKAGDAFSSHAVAIQGNMIVVGAQGQDGGSPDPNDDRGAVYIFTRSGTVWTQQRKINPSIGISAPADQFGISVDVDLTSGRNAVIVGARAAAANDGTARTGAAYIYNLDCKPPYQTTAVMDDTFQTSRTACPGASVIFHALSNNTDMPYGTYQWRKNGVNIPLKTQSSFRIDGLSASDEGSYDVIYTNACGTEVSAPAILSIHTFSLSPSSQNYSATGSAGLVGVSSTGSCPYTAVSNAPWITVTSGASGSAPNNVGFTVAANTGPAQRSGTINIAGQTFTVTQDGTVPPANTIQFSQSSYSTSEGAGSTTITVARSGDLSSPATVEYATTDGTASDRGDYNTTIGRLRFAAGESAKAFDVIIADDAYAEGTESLNLMLSNPTGGTALGSTFSAAISISDNDGTTSTSNPLDTTAFFVRQHYVDFFSREPDPPGLSFWTNNIDSCGADLGCREVKRVDTSAAFFLSIEFQETGFLVHRLYRAAFNRLSRYREFVRDTQEIGRGVVINSPGWEAQLEANKAAFVSDFAARAAFQTAYAGLTNAQYVDALNANTAGSLSAAERDALVAGLNGATETRATVLRKVAEDADVRSRETSPAFVLMQYYGYLRRNPDDSPDADFAGYNFWLSKLNEFGGDYRRAEMVRAFLQSTEYRKRFGL